MPTLTKSAPHSARYRMRFTTLEAICKALDCQPGDILEYVPGQGSDGEEGAE